MTDATEQLARCDRVRYRAALPCSLILVVLAALLWPPAADAQPFSAAERQKVDALVAGVLAKSDTPSASVVVVRGDRIAFSKAYGEAALQPRRAATTDTRYEIGSIAKQFTATLVLMLVDEGRLSLDDKVGRYLPNASGADQVTIRQLLSQTAGYPNYWVVSYLRPAMRRDVRPQQIVDTWGRQPLMFQPGAQWNYSNTNYVLAGRIVETVEGRPLAETLESRLFRPLAMASAHADFSPPVGRGDAEGYTRVALGPRRSADRPPPGWEFAAGGLSMTPEDLAQWDLAMLGHRLLSPAAYLAQQTSVRLADGSDAHYGLGLYVQEKAGHRILRHDGSTPGFLTENRVYPDDHDAIIVAVNADFGSAPSDIADGLQTILLGDLGGHVASATASPAAPPPKPVDPATTALAERVLRDFALGRIDRNLFTANDLGYLTPEVRADLRRTLTRLGPPASVELVRREPWSGYDGSIHEVSWPHRKLVLVMLRTGDGRLDDFDLFSPD